MKNNEDNSQTLPLVQCAEPLLHIISGQYEENQPNVKNELVHTCSR